MLAALETTPAVLVDRRLDMTSWNPAYAALWGDPAAIEPRRRNLMWTLAAQPAAEGHARRLGRLRRTILAHFRAQTAVRMAEDRTQEIYAALHEDAPDLADWWACHGVGEPASRATELALAGDVRVQLMTTALRPVEDPEALLLLHAPARRPTTPPSRRPCGRPPGRSRRSAEPRPLHGPAPPRHRRCRGVPSAPFSHFLC